MHFINLKLIQSSVTRKNVENISIIIILLILAGVNIIVQQSMMFKILIIQCYKCQEMLSSLFLYKFL